MILKNQVYKIKGMNKDLSYSSFNPEYSWDNKNIRLTARDNNNLFSITNERGTLLMNITNEGTESNIVGKVLGSCVLNEYLVLFTTFVDNLLVRTDRIYRISKSSIENSIIVDILYVGQLNFNENNQIQSIPFYENESIQKVYWIDGLNQPRVINIVASQTVVDSYNNDSFNFSQNINLSSIISVSKIQSGGSFKSGVIQYSFSYYNDNGVESSIFYTSPLLYISPSDRGGKPDEIVNNSFNISLSNLDLNFKYIRIYSIYRSSIDTSPIVTKVVDLAVSDSMFSYTDNGSTGETLSSDILLYIGSEDIIPQCMSQKNNTLFVGNIFLNTPIVPISSITDSDIVSFNWIKGDPIQLELLGNDSFYPYRPESLNDKYKKIKHFKFDEIYRLGVQGQYSNGKYSTPIWISQNGGDVKIVDKRYTSDISSDNKRVLVNPTYGQLVLSKSICGQMLSYGFKKIRPVIVPMTMNDRNIVSQGIITNTLSTLTDRNNKSTNVFSMPDYLIRLNNEQVNNECLRINTGAYIDYQLEFMGGGNVDDYPETTQTASVNSTIYDSYLANIGYDKRSVWFKDTNFVNFWSPDLIYNQDTIDLYIKNATKVGIYGMAINTGYDFNIDIDGNWPTDNGFNLINKPNNFNISNYNFNSSEFKPNIHKSLFGAMYKDRSYDVAMMHYPIWSPSSISFDNTNDIGNIIFTFTKYDRYNSTYFGLSNNLYDDKRYEFNINTPSFITNSGNIFVKTNQADNAGSIIYNKSINKNYASNSFANKITKWSDGNIPTGGWWIKETPSSMFVKYNSQIHAAFSFANKSIGGINYSQLLPTTINDSTTILDITDSRIPYWRQNTGYVNTKLGCDYNFKGITGINSSSFKNSLLIFDIYKDSPIETKYGGTSIYAITNNQWVPAGELQTLSNAQTTILYNEGDTYIQRCDILKTYTDANQIPSHNESISFLCESINNLDGRSDVNRYNKNINLMSNSNFGLFNNIYSQKNNYFNYNILDPLIFKNTKFNNTIVWSKTKSSGSTIDNWTSLSMLSSIDLEGINGEISSINLWNNELYAFQPRGIARLLYNERVQQQSSDNVSIEMVNGYKVPDYRYVTNQYGCSNKKSIIEGKNGIYFIDYVNKSLNILGDGLKDLSVDCGFKSWFNNNTTGKDYTLSYDKSNRDIYIHDNDNCLNFSEVLQSFVSFYDYVSIPKMNNIWNNFISINYNIGEKASNIWLNNSGDYNLFYNEPKEFHVEYIVNPDPLVDKIFNTIEYRLDNQSIDWTDVYVNNWFQTGTISNVQYIANMKRKFNVNRIQFPRQDKSMNRIRSTWTKVRLNNTPNTINNNNRFEMQDLNIAYMI